MADHAHNEKIDKKQLLLETAEKLFAQHGFEAVSIRQLAAESGVNLAMVNYYFGSKDGLFEQLLAARFPYTRGILEALAANTTLSPWEKISRTIDMYADKFFSKTAFHRIIMREMSLKKRPVHVQIIADFMEKNMEVIRGFIEEGQEKGQFRYVDANLTIVMFFGALSSYVNNSTLICKMMAEPEEVIFDDAHKERFKVQVKSMLQAHLFFGMAG